MSVRPPKIKIFAANNLTKQVNKRGKAYKSQILMKSHILSEREKKIYSDVDKTIALVKQDRQSLQEPNPYEMYERK